jgi:hypothetical protein
VPLCHQVGEGYSLLKEWTEKISKLGKSENEMKLTGKRCCKTFGFFTVKEIFKINGPTNLSFKIHYFLLGGMVHACNPSPQEAMIDLMKPA